jgi:5-methylcytosine-specific restriction protein A
MTKAPKIAKAQGRSVKEWIGATPDAKVPERVRLRILRRANHTCALSGIKIADGQAFDLEHVKPIEEGGLHAESNLVPVLRLAHEIKTAAERKRAAKADRVAKRAHGMAPEPTRKIESRGFEPSGKKPKIDKGALPPLGPPSIARRFAPQ